MSRKHNKWLVSELPTLVSDGVIDGATAERLRSYCEGRVGVGRNWAVTVFAVLGSSLVGLGVILLLAHNWSGLSRPLRTLLSLLPLACAQLLAGFALVRGKQSTAWREGVGVGWSLAIGASIALVAQTYHIPGSAGRFMMTWMLLVLPVIYLLRACAPTLIYLAGITAWATHVQSFDGQAHFFWPLAALILPHVMREARGNRYRTQALVIYWGIALTLCVAVGVTLEKALPGLWIIIYSSLFACMYLVGAFWFDEVPGVWQRPFAVVGSSGALILAFVFTYDWPWDEVGWHFYRSTGLRLVPVIIDYALTAMLPVAALFLVVTSLRRGKSGAIAIGLFSVAAIMGYAFAAGMEQVGVAMAIFNVYVLIVGLAKLVQGFRQERIATVNSGLLIVFALILLRFFDSDLGFVSRGIIFIVLGAVFLVTNLVMVRRKGVAR